jgi:hypothetical protein
VHASIRYYIEHHPEPVPGPLHPARRIVAGLGVLRVGLFHSRFGRLSDFLPTSGLAVEAEGFTLGRLAKQTFVVLDPPADTIVLPGLDG